MLLSPRAAQHVHSPRNAGRFEGATHVGIGGVPGDGPYVRMWLRVEGQTVRRAGYECNGCPSSIAAASMAAGLATGRTLSQIALLEPCDLLLLLGGLPEGKEEYADLAVQALLHPVPLHRP
ncbi:hypothetical protein EON79_06985 [bacterium]|nr:MAG: hypothetical protein EON79_06985 [bacterium]